MTLSAGDVFEKEISFSQSEVEKFAEVSGDHNPIHLDREYARKAGFDNTIVHGMLTASAFSRVLGTEFPGEGTIYLKQTLGFRAPVYPDEPLRVTVTVEDVSASGKVRLATQIAARESNEIKLSGEAVVLYRKK